MDNAWEYKEKISVKYTSEKWKQIMIPSPRKITSTVWIFVQLFYIYENIT